MQGLAAQQAPDNRITVEQVVQALTQGMTPEQLIQAGVPEELIMEAMELLKSQQSYGTMGQTQGPTTGLAESALGM